MSPAPSRLDNALEPPDGRVPAPPEYLSSSTQGSLKSQISSPRRCKTRALH